MNHLFGPDGRLLMASGVNGSRRPAIGNRQSAIANSFLGHAFEAAQRTGFNGMFWLPHISTSAMMPQDSRETIAQKATWLYNNVGPVRTVIDGLSRDEVDIGCWPKADTSNPAFNSASTERFHESWKDARFFDTRKVETVYSAQYSIRRHIRLPGELFAQMIRPDAQNPYVRCHFIPAWQVSMGTSKVTEGWDEGVHCDRFGAVDMYRVITKADGSDWIDVPAEDMLHFHDEFWTGQKRGMSCLAAVAKKLFTMRDIENALANGIQLRTDIAYTLERKEGDMGGPALLPNAVAEEVEVANGDGTTSTMIAQRITGRNGNESTIFEPPAGRTLKVVESNAALEPLGFKRDILADLAYTSGYHPDYVFSLAGGALGTEIRWKVRRVQMIKNMVRQNQLVPQFLEPLYRFRTWQDIKSGFYDRVDGGVPADWWKFKINYPPDTSVDIGREGRLHDERFATGKMSPADYFAVQGTDADDVDAQMLELRFEREKKLAALNKKLSAAGLPERTYETLWPANTAGANAAVAATTPEEE